MTRRSGPVAEPWTDIEFESGVHTADDGADDGSNPFGLAALALAVGVLALGLMVWSNDTLPPTEVWLIDGAASSFSLVELNERPDGQLAVKVVGPEGSSHDVGSPLFFDPNLTQAWPGAAVHPFVTVGDHVVFPSSGEVVATALSTGLDRSLGEGIRVLDAVDEDEFWVVGPGARWVTRRGLDEESPIERHAFDEVGRPLVSVGDGLVVFPLHKHRLGPLGYWTPARGLRELPIPSGFDLLGSAGDVIVAGSQTRLLLHDVRTGELRESNLTQRPDLGRAALSPDGALIALAQDHDLTSLGSLLIVNTRTGATVAEVDGIIDREFSWTSPDTLVTIGFEASDYHLVEFNAVSGLRTSVAQLEYPWVYIAATTPR